MKTEFEFNPDLQEMVQKHFPDWQNRLKEAARNELLDMLIACFKEEKRTKRIQPTTKKLKP